MFGDAGSLNCSMQMGFISSLELTLECSQPICLVGDQRWAWGAMSDTASSEDFPGKYGAIAWFPEQPLDRAVAPAAERWVMMTRQVGGKRKCEELSWLVLGLRFVCGAGDTRAA